MSVTVPARTDTILERGDRGAGVFALQRLGNRLGYPTQEDGVFGPNTEATVKKIQTRVGTDVDGRVGPDTNRVVMEYLCDRQENIDDLPPNLLLSKLAYESGGAFGAVNWSVAGGVDCGTTQRRVLTVNSVPKDWWVSNLLRDRNGNVLGPNAALHAAAKFDSAAVKRAFDPTYQLGLSGNRIRELHDIFIGREAVNHDSEWAYRLAVLNHNYPSLADSISRVGIGGLSTYYKSPQKWVMDFGRVFPDGTFIRTPLEWGQRYSLGNSSHKEPGQAVKMVSRWA